MLKFNVNKNVADLVLALFFVGIFVMAFLVSLSFEPPVLKGDPGAAFFPKLIAGASIIFGIVLIIQRIFRLTKGDSSSIDVEIRPFLVSVASVALLLVGINLLGSEISIFLFLMVLLGLRTGRWLWAAVFSAVSTIVIYFVFVVLLKVHLPLMFLPRYLFN